MRNTLTETELDIAIADEIMHVSRRLLQRGTRVIDDMGIGVGQVPILKLLSIHGVMTQRQIADKIRVTPATICGTLKRMERAELIDRRQAAEDGRVIHVCLTEKGRRCSETAREALRLPYSEMLSGFTVSEREHLLNYFRRMGENLAHTCKDEELPNDNTHSK